MTTKTQEFKLAFVLTGPPGPVTMPGDCPGYGQELPTAWRCQENCSIAGACYAAWTIAPLSPLPILGEGPGVREDSNGHH